MNINLDEISIVINNVEPEVNLSLDLNSFHSAQAASFVHTQNSASIQWNINHNLGYRPIVQLFNTGSQVIIGDITHISVNQSIIQFSAPVAGFARLI